MKELTIEQKAQRYDEVLEKARQLCAYPTTKPFISDLQDFFPELKESEDERIKKCVKYAIDKLFLKEKIVCDVRKNDVLAWLEKQGEQDPYNGVSFKYNGHTWGMCARDNGVDILLDRQLIKHLEKQGEKYIENYDEKIRKGLISFFTERAKYTEDSTFNGLSSKEIIAWLEKQDEKKPADKVEPKFHEGEWLCENKPNNYARFIQILETVNVQGKERYRISRDLHNDEDIVEFDFVEKYYHKFDIKDAKDGDILAVEPENGYPSPFVAIYKERGLDFFNSHCFISFDGKFNEGTTGHSIYHVHPATKEQRDTLMKTMSDAGYKWNAENKELKKIEQKPAEWEPQTGDTFRKKGTTSPTYHLCNKREDGITFGFVENCEVGIAGGEITIFALKNDYELVERLKSIEDVVEKELNKELQTKNEQKPAWSAEDEYCIHQLIVFCENCMVQDAGAKRCAHWLKSLKNRYTWKPSLAQMNALSIVSKGNAPDDIEAIVSLYNDLKKLKEE